MSTTGQKNEWISFGTDRYHTAFRYLSYDDYSDMLGVPLRIRERHFTEDTDEACVQAIGTHLNIMVWSQRDDVIFRLPLCQFRTSDMTNRKMKGPNKGHIAIGQFSDVLRVEGDEIPVEVIVHDFPKP